MRVSKIIVLVCISIMVGAGIIQAEEEKKAVPIIEVEHLIYDFGQVNQGEIVKHDFRVFNRGSAPLKIKSVKPG
jgi:hypothetical protein